MAIGHKIIVAAYHILTKNEKYKEPPLKNKAERARKKSLSNYVNKIEELGVTPEELMKIIEKKKGPFFTESQNSSMKLADVPAL